MAIKNHLTGAGLKVEMVDLPFADGRRFRVRVNGQWAKKVPVASPPRRIRPLANKTIVTRQVRTWLVQH